MLVVYFINVNTQTTVMSDFYGCIYAEDGRHIVQIS